MRTIEEHLDDSGLKDLNKRIGVLMEIGDNDIMYGYEKSLSSIRPVTEVSVNDICVSGNFIGVVTQVLLDETKENDYSLKGLVVKYEDPDGKVRGEHNSLYVSKTFVFGEYINGVRVDTTKANVVDMSDIKIIKRDSKTYKNDIARMTELYHSNREGKIKL